MSVVNAVELGLIILASWVLIAALCTVVVVAKEDLRPKLSPAIAALLGEEPCWLCEADGLLCPKHGEISA